MADITLNVPVNGMGPVDVMMQDPPPGVYLVEITEAQEHAKKNEPDKKSAEITCTVAEGEAAGIATRIYLGIDFTKAFNIGHFVNLFTGVMQNLGKSAEEIKAKLAGPVQIPLSAFKGKKTWIIVKAAPDTLDEQGRKPLADKNFVTREQAEQAKKSIALLGMPAPRKAAASTVPPTATPPTTGASVVNGATGAPTPSAPPPPTQGATPALGDLFG